MCSHNCNHKDPIYTDRGTYWLVQVICSKCGKVLKEWQEPKTEDEK